MNIKYVGYHGTLLENGENILRTKHYKYSTKPDEWLGEGVYFFEESNHAVTWCIEQKCDVDNNEYVVLVSNIECEDSKVLDVSIPEERVKYFKIMEALEVRMKVFIGKKRIKGDGFVFNHMYEKFKFDMIRALFFCSDKYYERFKSYTRLQDLQYQLCVRNRECIKSVDPYLKGCV